MPQLDFSMYAPQLVWLVITFVFLYLVMSRVALPKIGSVIEERRDKIADDLDRASELKTQAEEALSTYEQSLAEARRRAHGIAAETRDQVKTEADEFKAESDGKIAAHMRAAEKKIQEAKEAAMENIRDMASAATIAIIEKLIGEHLDVSLVGQALDTELDRS